MSRDVIVDCFCVRCATLRAMPIKSSISCKNKQNTQPCTNQTQPQKSQVPDLEQGAGASLTENWRQTHVWLVLTLTSPGPQYRCEGAIQTPCLSESMNSLTVLIVDEPPLKRLFPERISFELPHLCLSPPHDFVWFFFFFFSRVCDVVTL